VKKAGTLRKAHGVLDAFRGTCDSLGTVRVSNGLPHKSWLRRTMSYKATKFFWKFSELSAIDALNFMILRHKNRYLPGKLKIHHGH
jgi:hypothetical protein